MGRRCTGPKSAKIRGFLARNEQERQEATKRARERLGENAVLAAVNKSFAKKDIWLNCLQYISPLGTFDQKNAVHHKKEFRDGAVLPRELRFAKGPCCQRMAGRSNHTL
jgi:hypothetical protein